MKDNNISWCQRDASCRQLEKPVVFQTRQSTDHLGLTGQRSFNGIRQNKLLKIIRLSKEGIYIITSAIRADVDFPIMMLDIDHFHPIIKCWGHNGISRFYYNCDIPQRWGQSLIKAVNILLIGWFAGHDTKKTTSQIPVIQMELALRNNIGHIGDHVTIKTNTSGFRLAMAMQSNNINVANGAYLL